MFSDGGVSLVEYKAAFTHPPNPLNDKSEQKKAIRRRTAQTKYKHQKNIWKSKICHNTSRDVNRKGCEEANATHDDTRLCGIYIFN